ncbi:hypothetical protein ACP70R_009471 [Stipagrostis hirtigluma subsp. patula]
MSVDGINRKHIASHLQKHPKLMEGRENNEFDSKKSSKGTSRSKYVGCPKRSPDVSHDYPCIQQARKI